MKKYLFLFITFIIIAGTCEAKIWRVNNNPGGISANATTIQAAHDSASAGDTLHIESSIINYGNLNCTKRLVIFGTGYFLNENQDMQALLPTSTVGYIYLNATSDGTIIAGLVITSETRVMCSNVVIMRNYLTSPIKLGSTGANITIANILIKQNFITVNGYYSGEPISCHNSPTITNLVLRNNLIYQISPNGGHLISLPSSASGTLENNVLRDYNIAGGINVSNFTLKNNILVEGTFTGINCSYNNNIGNSTQFGTANGNQSNVSMSGMFVGPSGNSTDGAFKLASGSPAIGAGEFGTNCGMYGGNDPYILSGMPPIPAVYYYNTNGNGNQQNIRVKVKSHN